MLCSHREILYTHDNVFSRAIGDNVTESHKYNFEEKKPSTNSTNFMIPFMWSKKQTNKQKKTKQKGKAIKNQDSIDSVVLGEGVARDL